MGSKQLKNTPAIMTPFFLTYVDTPPLSPNVLWPPPHSGERPRGQS